MQLVDLNGRYGTISVVKNNIKRAVHTSLRRDDVAAVIADKHATEFCTNKKRTHGSCVLIKVSLTILQLSFFYLFTTLYLSSYNVFLSADDVDARCKVLLGIFYRIRFPNEHARKRINIVTGMAAGLNRDAVDVGV